jgi:hypothetical protein
MKLIGIISTAVLSLTLGVAAPVYAQQEQHDQEEQKAKPAHQDEKKAEQAKPAKQAERATQQQNNNAKQTEKAAQQQNKDAKQAERATQQQDQNAKQAEKATQQQDRNTKQSERTTQQQYTQQDRSEPQEQRAGGNGARRIPDDRFRAKFGQEHRFRVSQADYSRDRRFQYGGYWFGFVDPWPANWLYSQDVFVVDIDGVYYLCNSMYPGVNIALSVEL